MGTKHGDGEQGDGSPVQNYKTKQKNRPRVQSSHRVHNYSEGYVVCLTT